jgi:hypothetical protein
VIKGKTEKGDDITRVFFIQAIDSNKRAYLQVSKNFYEFKRYLDRIDGKKVYEDGEQKLYYQAPADVRYTKIKLENQNIVVRPGTKINIASYDTQKKLETIEMTVESVYWLMTKSEGNKELYQIPEGQKDKLKQAIEQCKHLQADRIQSFLSAEDKVNISRA